MSPQLQGFGGRSFALFYFLCSGDGLGAKFFRQRTHETRQGCPWLEQGLEIEGEHNFICLIGGVGVAKRGLSPTSALSRPIIPISSINL